ncbi:MAG: CarD family transcriptional regulator, partial [Anaerolineae bacterium]
SVGDKIVHPYHGPGRITGIEQKELLDGTKRYYVIEVPGPGLTVYMPVRNAEEIGVRSAMSRARLARVLNVLRGKPHTLPADYRKRQEQVYAQLRTGHVTQLVRVVRDLSWHGKRDHLTQRDADYLRQALDLLVAEMALVSGEAVSDVNDLIQATMTDAMAGHLN